MSDATPPTLETIYCANHPNRETLLRCNRCNKPICVQCAVSTPTGYRCKECVRGQQKTFDTAHSLDYPLAVVIAGVISFGGSLIASAMGFFILFIAPVCGVIAAEAVRWAVGRRRSRLLFQLATAGAVLGSAPLLLIQLLGVLLSLGSGMGALGYLWPVIWQGVYAFLVASTLYYRLAGIQIR